MRQKPYNKMPIHFYYVEFTLLEEIIVFLCFILCLAFIAVFYGIDAIYGNSGNPGVPYIAEVGVRYNLIDPPLFNQLTEYRK